MVLISLWIGTDSGYSVVLGENKRVNPCVIPVALMQLQLQSHSQVTVGAQVFYVCSWQVQDMLMNLFSLLLFLANKTPQQIFGPLAVSHTAEGYL